MFELILCLGLGYGGYWLLSLVVGLIVGKWFRALSMYRQGLHCGLLFQVAGCSTAGWVCMRVSAMCRGGMCFVVLFVYIMFGGLCITLWNVWLGDGYANCICNFTCMDLQECFYSSVAFIDSVLFYSFGDLYSLRAFVCLQFTIYEAFSVFMSPRYYSVIYVMLVYAYDVHSVMVGCYLIVCFAIDAVIKFCNCCYLCTVVLFRFAVFEQ
eukprot:gene3424-2375_t